MVGDNGKYMHVLWQSKHQKSNENTLAAETLTKVDLAEATFFYRKFIPEFFGLEDETRNVYIICYINNVSLPDFFHSNSTQEIVHWNYYIWRRLSVRVT